MIGLPERFVSVEVSSFSRRVATWNEWERVMMLPADDDDEEDDLDGRTDDVSLEPTDAADPKTVVEKKVPRDVRSRFEVYSYRNAAVILRDAHGGEFEELMTALRGFSITTQMIRMPGGNESKIPPVLSKALRPKGWHETIIQGDLKVTRKWKEAKVGKKGFDPKTSIIHRERFLDGHKIDYVKNKVAFDLEWNSKDQTFDRDLFAFSAFAQCGVIDVGVLLTRSLSLDPVIKKLGFALNKDGTESKKLLLSKYGKSTTHMGKLLYRLNAGRNGGCPILAIGITPSCISDWT